MPVQDQTLALPIAADYEPSVGELNNLCYLTLKFTVGWGMRQADLAICLTMAGPDPIVGDAGVSRFVYETCEYAWDHLSGEPAEFSPEDLFEHIKPILAAWYAGSTPAERAITD